MEDSYVLQLQEPKFREFYLSYSGYAQCGPLHCYGPASRPHYLIHFVVKGKGMYQVSGQKHYLTAGQGFLIEPGTQTFYQADKDDPWSYLWIGVGGTNAGKYIRDIGLNSEQLIFRSESGEELKKIVLDILKHTESTTSNLYYLQGRLYDFFSVLTKDVVIDTYLGNTKEKKYGNEQGKQHAFQGRGRKLGGTGRYRHIERRAGNVGRTRHVAQGGENECDTAQPGAAWCGRGDGRHATAGAQGRRTAARNPRHQTLRTTVAPPYI